MLYKSTRGGSPGTTFEQALFSGYAPDKGLFVPEIIPKLTPQLLTEWKSLRLTYPEVVNKIVRMYISPKEISNDDLHNCVRRAYNTFSKDEVIAITPIKNNSGNTVNIAELFHGRSGSFKDLAMSLVGQLLTHFMAKKSEHVIILVGTSGDTGSAAIEAVRGSKNADVIVLYPKGKISPVQEWQFRSALEENVHLFEVEGTSDDLDVPIKKCFPADGLISLNAINWARIMIQIAHYVYIFLIDGAEEVSIVVPTGAAGNLTAGVFAHRMGVPLKLYVATNKNDVVDVVLSKGILNMNTEVEATPANAMDICNPYNIERILYLFSNSQIISAIMDCGEQTIAPDVVADMRDVIKGSLSVDNKYIYEMIKLCWDINKYLICPHTATALYYCSQKLSGIPGVYILSTASPFKFAESVERAGVPMRVWNSKNPFESLRTCQKTIPKIMSEGKDWYEILQDEIKSIKSKHCAELK